MTGEQNKFFIFFLLAIFISFYKSKCEEIFVDSKNKDNNFNGSNSSPFPSLEIAFSHLLSKKFHLLLRNQFFINTIVLESITGALMFIFSPFILLIKYLKRGFAVKLLYNFSRKCEVSDQKLRNFF